MKCRCGHGRSWHQPTQRGRAYAARERQRGRAYIVKSPCRMFVRSGPTFPSGAPSGAIVQCKCRNWHPAEVRA